MPSPKSPPTLLGDSLNTMPALANFAPVLVGGRKKLKTRPCPSVVLIPIEGPHGPGLDVIASLVDVDLKMLAIIWAKDIDQAWDLKARLVQALKQHAIGNPTAPFAATPSQQGFFITYINEEWDPIPDAAQDGEEVGVAFTIRAAVAPVQRLGVGLVAATSIAPAVLAGNDYATLLLAQRTAAGLFPRNYWTLDYGTKCTTGSAGCIDRGSAGQALINLAAPIDQQSFVPSSLTGAARIQAADSGSLRVNVGAISSTPFAVETWLTAYTQVAPLTGMVGLGQFSIGLDAAGHFLIWGGSSAIVTSSRLYAPGARHFVMARYNTSGTLWDLWVDGTLVGSAVHAAPAISGDFFQIQGDGNDVAFEHPALTLGLPTQAQQIATTALADLL